MKVYHIFCDESCQSNDRYMVLGGIIVSDDDINKVKNTLIDYRIGVNMHAELKWSKVKHQKYSEYKTFVDYFFSLINNDIMHFKCMIIDNHLIDHKKHNFGDKELGFYKFYYQFILHCFGGKYADAINDYKFIIYPDYRNSKYSLNELKDILNNGIRKNYGIKNNPFVSIEPIDSKKSDLMQVNDIILGSIGFIKNEKMLIAGASKAKIQLSSYILNAAGIYDVNRNTQKGISRFSVWNFRPKNKASNNPTLSLP